MTAGEYPDEWPLPRSAIPDKGTYSEQYRRFESPSGKKELRDQYGLDDDGFDIDGKNREGRTREEQRAWKKSGKKKKSKLEHTLEEMPAPNVEDDDDFNDGQGLHNTSAAMKIPEFAQEEPEDPYHPLGDNLDGSAHLGMPSDLEHSVMDRPAAELEDEPVRVDDTGVLEGVVLDDGDLFNDSTATPKGGVDALIEQRLAEQRAGDVTDFGFEYDPNDDSQATPKKGVEKVKDALLNSDSKILATPSEEFEAPGEAFILDNDNPNASGLTSESEVFVDGHRVNRSQIIDSKRFPKVIMDSEEHIPSQEEIAPTVLVPPPQEDSKKGSRQEEKTINTSIQVETGLSLPLETRLGSFTLKKALKKGGQGQVYLAQQGFLGELAAVKTVFGGMGGEYTEDMFAEWDERDSRNESVDEDEDDSKNIDPAIRDFRSEAKITYKLDHPNVVKILDANMYRDEDDINWVWYAMELIEGGDVEDYVTNHFNAWLDLIQTDGFVSYDTEEWLRISPKDEDGKTNSKVKVGKVTDAQYRYLRKEHMKDIASSKSSKDARFSISSLVQIVRDASLGVAKAHEQEMVHRDLKPANFMIKEGVIKVADWGLAGLVKKLNEVSQMGGLKGTPLYMSPEQTTVGDNELIDARTDVYGMSAVLYHLVTGAPQHQTNGRLGFVNLLDSIAKKDVIPPHIVNQKLSKDLSAVILKGMQRDPNKRYQSMDELIEDLNNVLAKKPVNARKEKGPLQYHLGNFLGRNWWKLLGAAAAAYIGFSVLTARVEQSRQNDILDGSYTDAIATYTLAEDEFRNLDESELKEVRRAKATTQSAINQLSAVITTHYDEDKKKEAKEAKEKLTTILEKLTYHEKSSQIKGFESFYDENMKWLRKNESNYAVKDKEYDQRIRTIAQRMGALRTVKAESKDSTRLVETIDDKLKDSQGLIAKFEDHKKRRDTHLKQLEDEKKRKAAEAEQERKRKEAETKRKLEETRLAAERARITGLYETAVREYDTIQASLKSNADLYRTIPQWFDNPTDANRLLAQYQRTLGEAKKSITKARKAASTWANDEPDKSKSEKHSKSLDELVGRIDSLESRAKKRHEAYAKLEEYQQFKGDHNYKAAMASLGAAMKLRFESKMQEKLDEVVKLNTEAIAKRGDWASYQLELVAKELSEDSRSKLDRYDKSEKDEAKALEKFKATVGLNEFKKQLTERLLSPGNARYINLNDPQAKLYSQNDYKAFRHLAWNVNDDSFKRMITRFEARADQVLKDNIRAYVNSRAFQKQIRIERRLSDREHIKGGLMYLWNLENSGGMSQAQYEQYRADFRNGKPLPELMMKKILMANLDELYSQKGHSGLTQKKYGEYKGLVGSGDPLPDSIMDKIRDFYSKKSK